MKNLNKLEYRHGEYLATRVRGQGNKICMSSGRDLSASIFGVIRFLFYKDLTENKLGNWYNGSKDGDCYNS